MKEKLLQLIAKYDAERKRAGQGPYYDDASYYRAGGREDCLEDVISDLTKLANEIPDPES